MQGQVRSVACRTSSRQPGMWGMVCQGFSRVGQCERLCGNSARLVQRAELHVVRLHDVQVLQAQARQALVHAGGHARRAEVKVLLLQAIATHLPRRRAPLCVNSKLQELD